MTAPVFFAGNRGDIGGGEIMLLHLAEATRGLGVEAVVVGPEQPSDLVNRAQDVGFPVDIVPATDRRSYLLNLRMWDRDRRDGILWCNGLLPAVATTGRSRRVVHLHQLPVGKQRALADMARFGASMTLVPSLSMAGALRGARVLPNFVPAPESAPDSSPWTGRQLGLGFLGRLTHAKGVDVLASAVSMLEENSPGRFRLIVGGESRFVNQGEAAQMRTLIDELKSPTEWLGWIDPGQFFGAVDVLVVPSTWPESFGLVVAEAMAASIPVVVSDAGALPEVVGPDHPWIVPAGDPDALAQVLSSIASMGSEQRNRVVAAAHSRWASRYSPEAGRRHVEEALSALSPTTGPTLEGALT